MRLVTELGTLFGRARTRILLLGLAVVPVLIAVVVRISHTTPPPGKGPAFLSALPQNGVFAGLTGLDVVLPFLLPLAVAVVAGETIAGESALGTLRYLLALPVGRTRLLLIKAGAVLVFCLVACLVVALAGLVAGAALFPLGRVVTLSGTTVSLATGALRVVLAALYVATQAGAVGLIGIAASTLTDTPAAAMASTVVLAVLSEILDAVPQLAPVHPYLLSHEWLSFDGLLRAPVSLGGIGHGLALALVWGALAAAVAWARLTTRDILT